MSKFDPKRGLVMAVEVPVFGHALVAGDPLTIVEVEDGEEPESRGEVTAAIAEMLWAGGRAVYPEELRPTPVETREEEARRVVELIPLGNGYSAIAAPWLDEPIKVRGETAAQERYEEVVAAGRPLELETIAAPESDPVAITNNSGSGNAASKPVSKAGDASGAATGGDASGGSASE